MVINRYNIFAGQTFQQFSENTLAELRREVYEVDPDYLLGVNRDEYVEYLVEKHSFEPLVFDFENCAPQKLPSTLCSCSIQLVFVM